MAATKSKDIGKWFEEFVRDALVAAQGKKLCRFLRLYDTHAAGSFLPETAGDFMVAAKHGGWLVECKATAKYKTLRSCLADAVETHQAASLQLWSRFQPAYVWFFSSAEEVIEIWDGRDIGEARAAGKPLDLSKRLARFPSGEFGQWLETTLQQRNDE